MEKPVEELLTQQPTSVIDVQPHPSQSSTDIQPLEPHPSDFMALQPIPCNSRFQFKSDNDLELAKKLATPKNTERNTLWAAGVWKEWARSRQESYPAQTKEWPIHPYIAQPEQLNYWLSKFVRIETRKGNGEQYPPSTLYYLCCGLQRYVRDIKPDVNFFTDAAFNGFQKTLDSEMKRLTSLGIGVKKRQAEPISVEEESTFWEKKLLGDHSPQSLLDTMVYLCGVHFALRSGAEHRNLQITQFEIINPNSPSPSLIYTENVSKNHSGGLAHRKVQPKRVVHHCNISNPERCLVRLYQTYVEHCPKDRKSTAFYLTPLKKPKGDIWFMNTPVGHNTLNQTVKRLCQAAGIEGFKTNHSLRVTNATRLFASGVDEQLIMSRTGHHSVDGVRVYKRIGEEQQQQVSDVLNSATNGKRMKLQSNPESLPDSALSTSMHTSSSTVSRAHFFCFYCSHIIIFFISCCTELCSNPQPHWMFKCKHLLQFLKERVTS